MYIEGDLGGKEGLERGVIRGVIWGGGRIFRGGYLVSYLQGMHGGMHRGIPKVNLKTNFKKNHALAESLLSRVFSWDVVDVGFPTCVIASHNCSSKILLQN
jgi:hypothetical protein